MRKSKRKIKEKISENYCFLCKQAGSLLQCDHKDCLKSYHPHCAGKDANSRKSWKCDWHICCICKKTSKFQCFCCPTAVCGRCIGQAEFVVSRQVRGFCTNCLRRALLWEGKEDLDSNGGKIKGFTGKDIVEVLFIHYWEFIKEKEGLKVEHLQEAQSLLMKGTKYNPFEDANDFLNNDLDSLNLTDYEEENYTPFKRERKMSKSSNKKAMKREFFGWGSKALIDFVVSINEDISVELSQYDVTNIITRYVERENLFDHQHKKMVVCDQRLHSLFGNKRVNKNRIYSLLETHFASNIDESEEDHESVSEEKGDKATLTPCKKMKIGNPDVRSNCEKVMSRSAMAAVVAENLRLVYLKRSLVNELLKEPESFEMKVVGSFVRVKSDPDDYMQKNSHQLVQVTAVKKLPINGADTSVLLQVSNMPINVDIHMLSDCDFTKEELEHLSVQMKDGLLKKPTVWITKELALMKHRIEKANEKGWKRELAEYKERRRLLLEPSEQSRLIQKIPQVIAEEVELNADSDHDKERRNWGTNSPCGDSMNEGDTVDNEDIHDTKSDSDSVAKTEFIDDMSEISNTASVNLEHHDMTILPVTDQNALLDEISLPVTAQHEHEGVGDISLDDEDEQGENLKVEEVELNASSAHEKERRNSGTDPPCCYNSMNEGDTVDNGDIHVTKSDSDSVAKTEIINDMSEISDTAAVNLEDHDMTILPVTDQNALFEEISLPVTAQHEHEGVGDIGFDDEDEKGEKMKVEEVELNANYAHEKERRNSGTDPPCCDSMNEGDTVDNGDIHTTRSDSDNSVVKTEIIDDISDISDTAVVNLEDHDMTILPEKDQKALPDEILLPVTARHTHKGIETINSDDKDDDDDDEKGEKMKAELPSRAKFKPMEWLCMDPLGDVRGPYEMSFLRKCSQLSGKHSQMFKVWKIGQCSADVIPLPEAMVKKKDTAAVNLEDNDNKKLRETDQKVLPDEITNQEGIEIINLDDEDDNDDGGEGEVTEWYCIGPLGDVRGPYEMAFLRRWGQVSGEHSVKFKVWKIGQCSEDAIPLPEAITEKNNTAETDQKALLDEICLPVTPQLKQEHVHITDLDDDGDEKGETMKVGTSSLAENEAAEWYCMGPLGDVRGPYEMSFLRRWLLVSGVHFLKFKVWKIGQCSADAIPLPVACGFQWSES